MRKDTKLNVGVKLQIWPPIFKLSRFLDGVALLKWIFGKFFSRLAVTSEFVHDRSWKTYPLLGYSLVLMSMSRDQVHTDKFAT
jgi:hypothetical protein